MSSRRCVHRLSTVFDYESGHKFMTLSRTRSTNDDPSHAHIVRQCKHRLSGTAGLCYRRNGNIHAPVRGLLYCYNGLLERVPRAQCGSGSWKAPGLIRLSAHKRIKCLLGGVKTTSGYCGEGARDSHSSKPSLCWKWELMLSRGDRSSYDGNSYNIQNFANRK